MTTLSDLSDAQAFGNQADNSHELARLAANMKLLIRKMEANNENGAILMRQLQADMSAYDLLSEEV